jgi:hypothetical protein
MEGIKINAIMYKESFEIFCARILEQLYPWGSCLN